DQRQRYRGRNVVERCFNRHKQWRGIAMRSDKDARNYHAGLSLATTLHWLTTLLEQHALAVLTGDVSGHGDSSHG
ncbi:MAG: hypothetical protein Q4D18_10360, partial [Micrococcus sp.]|nr:hypothetical protein [Micrococcus sp.]